jgi:hypothetical protein
MLPEYLSAKLNTLAAELDASSCEPGDVVASAIVGRWGLVLSACHVDALAPAVSAAPDCPPLSACASDALEAASGEWVTSQELSVRAGWPYGGRWRGVIAELVRRGLLERDRRTKRLRLAP